ncbi:MAG: NAD(P)-dependent oxidoreductase [Alphaproteobacteria bacterium]|jgi:3-hydroxyisobutyrate dehydrogenase-like beta-hydroxyacid dehydrogenase
MSGADMKSHTVGWIGTGKMGYPMAGLLIAAGADVKVYNRTAAKAEPLGVEVVGKPSDLADRDIIFSIVTDDTAIREMITGPDGVLSGSTLPKIISDSSTVSIETSMEMRAACEAKGVMFLATPISGNGHAVAAGKATLGVSGPREAYDIARPYIAALGRAETYIGAGDSSRLAKLAHNVMLGVVAQCLAEITVLCEKGGIKRADFLNYFNNSAMSSTFTNYKAPALVNLDFTATHTSKMLRKDLDLALKEAKDLEVPMPVTNLTRELVQALIGLGHGEDDFASMIKVQAAMSGYDIEPENVVVSDGLKDAAE